MQIFFSVSGSFCVFLVNAFVTIIFFNKKAQIAVWLRFELIYFISFISEFCFVRNLPKIAHSFFKDKEFAMLLLRYGKKVLICLAESVFIIIPFKGKILSDVNRAIGFVHSTILYHNYGTVINSFVSLYTASTRNSNMASWRALQSLKSVSKGGRYMVFISYPSTSAFSFVRCTAKTD